MTIYNKVEIMMLKDKVALVTGGTAALVEQLLWRLGKLAQQWCSPADAKQKK
jgi:hypothetical protein